MGELESGKNSLVDKFVDFLFSRDERKLLIAILVLGLILRFLVASNVPPVADEMVHGVHAIGVSELKPLSTMTQGPVWFYLTDMAYRIFGVHLITARFLAFFFGSISILLVYLLASMIFNKKIGLIAAFLLAISPFHITWAASYQDQAMMFFVLMASYLFIKDYKKKGKISVLSSVFLGVALLIKIITGVFLIVFGAFILGILYKNYKTDKNLFKKNIKRAVLFGAIIVFSFVPVLAYNYFLYKEKGIVDLVFAQFLRINPEFYTGPGLAHGEGFVPNKLPKNLYSVLTVYFLKEDPILLFLSAFGVIVLLKKWRERQMGDILLLVMFFFALLFIASAIVLQTHYTSFIPLMAIFGAVFIAKASDKVKRFKNYRYIFYGAIILILLYNVYSIREPLTSKSAIDKMRSFSDSSFDKDTFIVADSRIYRGTSVWMFSDKNYVDSSYFPQIMQLSNAKEAKTTPIKVVFIECVSDDCGWGTIKDQPDLNQSVEVIVEAFRSISTKTENISGGGSVEGVRESEITGEPFFRVYETVLSVDTRVFPELKKTHNHFFYQIPRNEFPKDAFDYYTVNGFFGNLLNSVSYLILYFFIFCAFVSAIYAFYLVYQEN